MKVRFSRDDRGNLVGIVRQASLYDWLIARSRKSTRSQPLPCRLHADLGLPPSSTSQSVNRR